LALFTVCLGRFLFHPPQHDLAFSGVRFGAIAGGRLGSWRVIEFLKFKIGVGQGNIRVSRN
jgi:hypothetical protein